MLFEQLRQDTGQAPYVLANKEAAKEQYIVSLVKHLEGLLNARRNPLGVEKLSHAPPPLLGNYGLPDLSEFNPKSATDRKSLQAFIRQVIELYEPRLKNVKVEVIDPADTLQINLQFTIEATVCVGEQHVFLYFEIDPITTQAQFKEML